MVPSALVVVDRFPLTPNGKVDRKALPAPDTSRPVLGQQYVAPESEVEQKLAKVWAEVLGLDCVGVHDNFFDLGGHSILAVRLFVRMEAVFNKRLPVALLFEAPTVAQLARHLTQTDTAQLPWSPLVPIQPSGSKPPFFCIHGGGTQVLIYRSLARYVGNDQPLYGLQPQGGDGRLPCINRVEDMATLYLQAMRTVQPHGPYYLGGLSLGGMVAVEIAQRLRAEGEETAFLALFDTHSVNFNQ